MGTLLLRVSIHVIAQQHNLWLLVTLLELQRLMLWSQFLYLPMARMICRFPALLP